MIYVNRKNADGTFSLARTSSNVQPAPREVLEKAADEIAAAPTITPAMKGFLKTRMHNGAHSHRT